MWQPWLTGLWPKICVMHHSMFSIMEWFFSNAHHLTWANKLNEHHAIVQVTHLCVINYFVHVMCHVLCIQHVVLTLLGCIVWSSHNRSLSMQVEATAIYVLNAFGANVCRTIKPSICTNIWDAEENCTHWLAIAPLREDSLYSTLHFLVLYCTSEAEIWGGFQL